LKTGKQLPSFDLVSGQNLSSWLSADGRHLLVWEHASGGGPPREVRQDVNDGRHLVVWEDGNPDAAVFEVENGKQVGKVPTDVLRDGVPTIVGRFVFCRLVHEERNSPL